MNDNCIVRLGTIGNSIYDIVLETIKTIVIEDLSNTRTNPLSKKRS
ncbi:MAG: hypothetical protein R3A12_11650 [Ignavibacteria bacterium]